MEIIAHRGASHDAPENTTASALLAWRQGADALEIDIQASKDGQIVVFHDKTTERLGRSKPVAEQTLRELRELDAGLLRQGAQRQAIRIPVLQDVLATVPEEKSIFVEIKGDADCVLQHLRDLIPTDTPGTPQIVFTSFSLQTLQKIQSEFPRCRRYWNVKFSKTRLLARRRPSPAQIVQEAGSHRVSGVFVHYRRILELRCAKKIMDAGLALYAWTVNDGTTAREMERLGLQGIATDRPGWIRQALNATSRR